jgi:hypothetical protein
MSRSFANNIVQKKKQKLCKQTQAHSFENLRPNIFFLTYQLDYFVWKSSAALLRHFLYQRETCSGFTQ